jgi:hypothetical protein
VATGEGLLVAWKAREGAVHLARLGSGFERLGPDREIAGPAGPFALVGNPGGAALALVERDAHGGNVVLLARVSATGEARNVPRALGHAEEVDGVSLVWTGAGYVVAWGVAGTTGGTFVVLTDARGVPRGPARRVLAASAPRVVWLAASQSAVVVATAGAAEPSVAVLDEEGAVTFSARWPVSGRAVVHSPSGASVAALATPGDPASGALVLARWSLTGSAAETTVPLRAAPGATVVAAVPDRAGLVAAIDEPAGRELIVRVAMDGATTLLSVRPGSLGAIVPGNDAGFTVIGHEPPPSGEGRLAVLSLSCPRSLPVIPAPTGNATPTASPAVAPLVAATPPDAEGSADASGP